VDLVSPYLVRCRSDTFADDIFLWLISSSQTTHDNISMLSMTMTITLINPEDRGPARLHNLLPLPDPGLSLLAVLTAKAWRPMKDEEAHLLISIKGNGIH
jgi:hypothetical protein